MRQILGKLGLCPVGKSETELLYISPFNATSEPNFIISIKSNRWADLTDCSSGTVIDFACKYLKHYEENDTIVDAARWVKNIVGYSILKVPKTSVNPASYDKHYSYMDHQHLQTPHLIHYLEQARGIPLEIAQFNLVEVNVHNLKTGKSFLALGNKNDEGAFCIRNEHCKAQLNRPYISFLRGTNVDRTGLHIFKDIFDYLTALSIRGGEPYKDDVLILNNYYNMPASSGYIYGYPYKTVHTWLDNTLEGHAATCAYKRYCKTLGNVVFKKQNRLYANYVSLNAWHVAKKNRAAQEG